MYSGERNKAILAIMLNDFTQMFPKLQVCLMDTTREATPNVKVAFWLKSWKRYYVRGTVETYHTNM